MAYRYASTPTRKFVIADCPGHVQYTRNMATGASTADLALVVLDANQGLKEQTRRHLCIAALLGVRNIIVAANKMDMADWDRAPYDAVVKQIDELGERLGFESSLVIPVSALMGDNVVERSNEESWYEGPTVLEALEQATAGSWSSSNSGARLPIQWVLRQNGGGRTYAGMVNGASLHVGDAVTLLPQNLETTVRAIKGVRGDGSEAAPGLSVDVDLASDTDAGRGDMLATAPLPTVTREIEATVCWFGETPLSTGTRLRLKHTSRTTPARVSDLHGVVDIATLDVAPGEQLAMNEIGLVTIQTAEPLVVDDYRDNRVTGSFVLIDERTNATVAAGMVGHVDFL